MKLSRTPHPRDSAKLSRTPAAVLRRLPGFCAAQLLLLPLVACTDNGAPDEGAARPPNVLFIAVDDLNDWIEPLGGHPQARTPSLTRLADEGVLFTRAFTPSPSCNPSRTALLTGQHTYTSGMYSNYQWWRQVMPDVATLPRYFSDNGYWAAGAGKIFHNNQPDPGSWDDYFPSLEDHMPSSPRPEGEGAANMPAFQDMYTAFDWAPLDVPDEEMGDYQSVAWATEQLQRQHEKPFFLAVGIYRPHLPWYVPRKYFEMFPLDEVQLPPLVENDLEDVPERGIEIAERGGNYQEHVLAADQWRQGVRGYLASIAYADAMVGLLLDSLDASPHAANTIVVLWSDHGWQLGEKEHWRKFALWENLTRVVLMFRVPEGTSGLPGGTPAGARSGRTVSLLDLYPTLLELGGLPEKAGLDGRSLVPLLREPDAAWDRPVISTYQFSEYSIRDERFHYIRYIDGSEELYDTDADPEEWNNLADDPRYAAETTRLGALLPADPAPFVDTDYPLMPHHIPPLRGLDDYLERKATGARR